MTSHSVPKSNLDSTTISVCYAKLCDQLVPLVFTLHLLSVKGGEVLGQ